MLVRIYYILACSFLVNCSQHYDDQVDSLLACSGSNRRDIIEVLEHYKLPEDHLKKKAVLFLIENYPLDELDQFDKKIFLDNIELSFVAWKKPWATSLNFDQFKELILPFAMEKDADNVFWRERFLKEFSFVEDSLDFYREENSIRSICRIVNIAMARKYKIEFGSSIQPKNLMGWDSIRKGDCQSMSFLTLHILRSIGVPVAEEFTPHWANVNGRHYWNSVLIDGRYYPFIGTESLPGDLKVELVDFTGFCQKRSKVFRRTYERNKQSLFEVNAQLAQPERIPRAYFDSKYIDVSNGIIPVKDLTIDVNVDRSNLFSYLCVSSHKNWAPVSWAKNANGAARFSDMRSEVVYLPAEFKNSAFSPIGFPMILQKDGSVKTLAPNFKALRSVTLLRKYPYDETNLIKIGDSYLLSCWDGSGWKELGSKTATEKVISFDNIPENGLLLLQDLSRGKQERPFTYTDGAQYFW